MGEREGLVDEFLQMPLLLIALLLDVASEPLGELRHDVVHFEAAGQKIAQQVAQPVALFRFEAACKRTAEDVVEGCLDRFGERGIAQEPKEAVEGASRRGLLDVVNAGEDVFEYSCGFLVAVEDRGVKTRVDGFEISRYIEEVSGYLLRDVHDVSRLLERSLFIQDIDNALVEEREGIVEGLAFGQKAGFAAHNVIIGVACEFLDGVNNGAQARVGGYPLRLEEALNELQGCKRRGRKLVGFHFRLVGGFSNKESFQPPLIAIGLGASRQF